MGKLKTLLLVTLLLMFTDVFAQNPNQQVNLFAIPTMSTSFIRMPARDATQEVDGVYYNPAGLTGLPNGFTLQINNQFLTTSFDMMAHNESINESPADYSFYPVSYVFPTIFGAYKRNKFAFSFGVFPAVGGGGGSTIANLPSAEFPVADATEVSKLIIQIVEDLYGLENTHTDFKYQYDFDSKGLAFSPGFQVGLAFKLNEYVSFSIGGRYIYYIVDQKGGLSNLKYVNESEGVALSPEDYFNYVADSEPDLSEYLTLHLPAPLPDIELPVTGAELLRNTGNLFGDLLGDQQVKATQTSSGITPIIGMNLNFNNRWNIGLKYEHRTYINLVTKVHDGLDGGGIYVDGREKRADLPGFLTSGVTFKPNDKWTFAIGNRLFFNKRANLNGREANIVSLSKEFELAAEYQVLPRLVLSGGATYRTVRYNDDYYTEVDYYLPAWTVAGGFKADISRRISVEAGFLSSFYVEKTYYQDSEFFGGQLALVGAELPEVINDALKKEIQYDVDGKAFVASVGINFWMGSLDQNRKDRKQRVDNLKDRRSMLREDNKQWKEEWKDMVNSRKNDASEGFDKSDPESIEDDVEEQED